MIAVIFEVEPAPGQEQVYLELAANLKPLLADIDGFISIERFRSLSNPDRLLSLSFWRDEEAVSLWRNVVEHRDAQVLGRSEVFREYRLRIGAIVRDYGMTDRAEAPQDSVSMLG